MAAIIWNMANSLALILDHLRKHKAASAADGELINLTQLITAFSIILESNKGASAIDVYITTAIHFDEQDY